MKDLVKMVQSYRSVHGVYPDRIYLGSQAWAGLKAQLEGVATFPSEPGQLPDGAVATFYGVGVYEHKWLEPLGLFLAPPRPKFPHETLEQLWQAEMQPRYEAFCEDLAKALLAAADELTTEDPAPQSPKTE